MQSVALSTQILPPCKISRIFDPTLFVVANDEFNTTFITYFYKFHPAINLNVQQNFLIESPIWILMSRNQPFTLITQTQLWPADCSFIVLMARLLAATEVGILQTWNISFQSLDGLIDASRKSFSFLSNSSSNMVFSDLIHLRFSRWSSLILSNSSISMVFSDHLSISPDPNLSTISVETRIFS